MNTSRTLTVAAQPVDECCAPASSSGLGEEEASAAAAVFKALGDPTRLRLVSMISAAGEESCVCDLTEAFDLSQPTISHHLKQLVDVGVLRRERRGTWSYYSMVPGGLATVLEQLARL